MQAGLFRCGMRYVWCGGGRAPPALREKEATYG